MQELWMIRYGEIFLKSASVRERWEQTLVTNIHNILPNCNVWRERGRIWLKGNVEPEQLNKVFGIVSFSKCTQFSLDQLHEICLEYCETHGIRQVNSFALRVRRVGNHAFTSQQVAQELGAIIQKQYPHLHVDLEEPEKEIFIEIRNNTCYLFDHVHRGSGGLPLGSKVL